MKLKDIATQYNLDLTELACALGVVVGKELGPDDDVELTDDVVAGIKDFLGVEIDVGASGAQKESAQGRSEENLTDKTQKEKRADSSAAGKEKTQADETKVEEKIEGKKKKKPKTTKKTAGSKKGRRKKEEKKEEKVEKETALEEEPKAEGDIEANRRHQDLQQIEEDRKQEGLEEGNLASQGQQSSDKSPQESDSKVEGKDEDLGTTDEGQEMGSPHQEAKKLNRGAEEEAVQEETPGGREDVPEGVGDERAVLLGGAAPPASSTTINIDENQRLKVKEQVVEIEKDLPESPSQQQFAPSEVHTSAPVEVETVESVEGDDKKSSVKNQPNVPNLVVYILLAVSFLSLFLMALATIKLSMQKPEEKPKSSLESYNDAELFALMYKMLEKGNYATAEDLFSELKTNFPDSKFLDDAAIYIADSFFEKRKDLPTDQRYQKAIDYYQMAYELTSRRFNKEKALFQIALALFYQGDYKGSIKKFEEFEKTFPVSEKNDQARYYQGLAYYKMGDIDKAIEQFWTLIHNYPNSKLKQQSYYYLVKMYFEKKDFDKVSSVAPVFIKKWPDSQYLSKVLFMYADALIKQGKVYKAIKAYNDAQNKLSQDLLPKLLFRKAKAYELVGDKESAIKTYLQLADKFKYDELAAESLKRSAELSADLGRLEEAVKIYYQLKERFYKWECLPDSLYELAQVLARELRFKEAEKWLRFILKKYPDYPDRLLVRWTLARMLELEGKYISAVKVYDKLLMELNKQKQKNKEKLLKVYLAKADALLRAKEYRKAIGVFVTILTEFKKYKKLDRGKILYRLSIAYFYNGEYAKAIDSFKDAISASPLSPWRFRCRYMLGRTYQEVGEIPSAIDQFTRITNNRFLGDRALKALAFKSLGEIYYSLGKYDKAYDCFNKARALSSDWHLSTQLLKLQADALVGKKDFGSAIKLYAKYLDRLLQFYHAEIKDDNGRFSLKISKNTEQGFDKIAQALIYIADTHFRMGAYKTALKVYKKIAKLYEENKKPVPDWVLFQIAMCYKSENDMESAKQYFLKLKKDWPDSHWSKEADWQLNQMQIMEKLNKAKELLKEVIK